MFYKRLKINKRHIWKTPEKYTKERHTFDNIDNDDILRYIANLSIQDIKILCTEIIKETLKQDAENKTSEDEKCDAIDKINKMKFEIELD